MCVYNLHNVCMCNLHNMYVWNLHNVCFWNLHNVYVLFIAITPITTRPPPIINSCRLAMIFVKLYPYTLTSTSPTSLPWVLSRCSNSAYFTHTHTHTRCDVQHPTLAPIYTLSTPTPITITITTPLYLRGFSTMLPVLPLLPCPANTVINTTTTIFLYSSCPIYIYVSMCQLPSGSKIDFTPRIHSTPSTFTSTVTSEIFV